MGSYTARELERDTGFGSRTIAYYIQEGLLPRVGRRGPRTRYPEPVRDRLLFIRCVREAEAEGEVRPLSLSDLRKLFKVLPRRLVASVAAGEIPVTPDMVSLSSAERPSRMDRMAALRTRLPAAPPGPVHQSPASAALEGEGMQFREAAPRARDEDWTPEMRAMDESEFGHELREPDAFHESRMPSPREPDEEADALGSRLSRVLNELQDQARRGDENAPDSVATWSQVEVTSDIRLSVRGTVAEDVYLLRVAGRLLRRMLGRG